MSDWEDRNAPLVRREPQEEGNGQWGCFYYLSDQLAAVADSTRQIYELNLRAFEKVDAEVKAFVKENPLAGAAEVRQRVLGLLMQEGQVSFDATKVDYMKAIDPEDAAESNPTPNEIRDWFCWLYRKFKEWKTDQELSSKN